MNLTGRVRNFVRGKIQIYGTVSAKRSLWNSEFSQGRWDCLDSTPGDCVYRYIEKYACNGSILDLGCGSGSTANEIGIDTYCDYTGVDISQVAIEQARVRAEEAGRGARSTFVQGDIYTYNPNRKFDVILFRDSIYYVAPAKIHPMLERYSQYLLPTGVLIARMWCATGKYKSIVDTIENSFEIVAKCSLDKEGSEVLVFRAPEARADENTMPSRPW